MANRSISISLEEGLLAQLDAQRSNHSALVSEALSQWLARGRIDALNTAYAHLASLEASDLAERPQPQLRLPWHHRRPTGCTSPVS